jgi:L-serine deaminase
MARLVQVPRIERNATASVKAINTARLALHGGPHLVSLNQAAMLCGSPGSTCRTSLRKRRSAK